MGDAATGDAGTAGDRDPVGTTYEPYRYEVSREKIREYATALGEDDARYFSDGDDCLAPPTFAACFTILQGGRAVLADPALDVEPAPPGDGALTHQPLLHGAQAYEYGSRVLRPGDVLECTPRLAGLRGRGSSRFVTVEVDCRFLDSGRLAVRSESTFVLLDDGDGS